MEIHDLTFTYQKGEIYTVRIGFDAEPDDSVLIPAKYINELRKYYTVSEEDKDIFFILARAIQLKKENKKGNDSSVKKYQFGSKNEPFHEVFIAKLISVARQVPTGIIALCFGDDAKVEDLDIFLNRLPSYDISLMMLSGLALSDYQSFEIDDDFD